MCAPLFAIQSSLLWQRDDQSRQGCVPLCNPNIFSTCWAWWTSKTDTVEESQTDGSETLAPNPDTSLSISREILRVENWFYLILHLKSPGFLLSKWEHLTISCLEINNNIFRFTFSINKKKKCNLTFHIVEHHTRLSWAARAQLAGAWTEKHLEGGVPPSYAKLKGKTDPRVSKATSQETCLLLWISRVYFEMWVFLL